MAIVAALAFAGGATANEVVLFDAANGPAPVVGGNIEVNGDWDLSDCDTITVSFRDAKLVNDSYVVELANAGGDFRARRGVYTARLAVKRDGFKDESAPLPPDLGAWRDTMARLSETVGEDVGKKPDESYFIVTLCDDLGNRYEKTDQIGRSYLWYRAVKYCFDGVRFDGVGWIRADVYLSSAPDAAEPYASIPVLDFSNGSQS